jgi:hypothetical protein
MLSRRKLAAYAPVIAALFALGALAPMALADKGGRPIGSNSGGGGGTSGTSTTTSTSTKTTSAKGGGKPSKSPGGVTSPLTLTSEYVYTSPNPAAPSWCINEDDIDQRTFTGSLSGSYSTSYQICADWNAGIYWSAGGEGIETDISLNSPISDLVITSPTGDGHHAVLTGTTTYNGVTTYNYAACYVPPFSLSTNTGTNPLAGGTWTITLNGTFSKATWHTTVQMAYPSFQQSNCPPSEQNLTP